MWADDSGKQLIPSIVHVGSDGTVLTYPSPAQPGTQRVEYLKMLLAESNDRLFRSIRQTVLDNPIDDLMRPLAAAFLSSLIRKVRTSIIRRRPDLKQRRVNWFVNVGVPVQHYDANVDAFSEVAAVAFRWSEYELTKIKVNDLASAYAKNVTAIDGAASPRQQVAHVANGTTGLAGKKSCVSAPSGACAIPRR